MKEIASKAKASAFFIAKASTEEKNNLLRAIAKRVLEHQDEIVETNRKELVAAEASGLSVSMLDRLSLQNGRLDAAVHDLEQVIALRDPIGDFFDEKVLPNGLKVAKRRTPMGVLGVIYESRPNVTLDVSALAIKSGNAAILRGGMESLQTNAALVKAIQEALESEGFPKEVLQFISSPNRELVKEMLRLHETIDLIIPRGNTALQQFCRENSTIPVLSGGVGICHLFVDETAHLEKSIQVLLNAKTQRPTVCNALDTLLIHAKIAQRFLPHIVKALYDKKVELRCDPKAAAILQSSSLAAPQDWDTEWLGLTLGVKVVEDLDEAIAHIRRHSTGHSDGILTEDANHANVFIRDVDSAAVYVNASTRFTDGGQLGLGAEVAISTQKLHARGPVGLQELTTYKWIVQGDYHFRAGS